MITPLQKHAFGLVKVLYGYLPELPIGWDPEYKRLVRKKNASAYLQVGLFMADAVFLAVGDVYIIYTHYFIKPRKNFGFNQMFALIFGGSFAFIMGATSFMFMYKIDDWLAGLNNIYVMEEKMLLKDEQRRLARGDRKPKKANEDLLGFGACAVVFALASTVPFITLLCIHERTEPVAYLLDDILPPAEYRELSTILLTLLIRFALLWPALTELHRVLTFLLLNGIVCIGSVMACLTWMTEKVESVEDFLRHFLPYAQAYRCMEFAMPDILFIILTSSYWGLVGLIFVCIKGFAQLDTWMYALIVLTTVVSIVVNFFAFQNLKTGSVMSIGMLERWGQEAKEKHLREKTAKSKALIKRVGATQPVLVSYGPFFKLGTDFVMSFFYDLTQREVDTVLMFDEV